MTSDLTNALKDVLERRGILDEVRARIRAEVYLALDDKSDPKPALCKENLIINELIREYLMYNNYKYTASVLETETGRQEHLTRNDVIHQLNVSLHPSSSDVPLLYSLVGYFFKTPRPS